jgi:hypothetical protein
MSESYYHMTAKEVMESLIKDLQDAHIKMKGYPAASNRELFLWAQTTLHPWMIEEIFYSKD